MLSPSAVLLTIGFGVVFGQGYNGGNSNGPIRVVSIVEQPWLNAADSSGKFSGFMVEVLDAMAAAGRFTYTLSLQPDGISGTRLANGTTTGAVDTLVRGNADMSAVDMSITQVREQAIDFLIPFYAAQNRILVNTADNIANVHYLVSSSSSIFDFIQTSTNPRDQAIWANIQANRPGSVVANYEEGVQRVLQGSSALLVGTPEAFQFVRDHPGQLRLTPDVLLAKYSAFGVREGSPFAEQLNLALLSVQESSLLQQLLDKYVPTPPS